MKTQLDNLENSIYEKVISIHQQSNYFVDPVNGSDDNDGSESSPFKTLRHTSTVLSNTYNANSIVNVLAGTYEDDAINISNTGGVIEFIGSEGTILTNASDTNAVRFTNCSGRITLGGMEIKSSKDVAVTIVSVYQCSGVSINDCVIGDDNIRQYCGVAGDRSLVTLSNVDIKNVGISVSGHRSSVFGRNVNETNSSGYFCSLDAVMSLRESNLVNNTTVGSGMPSLTHIKEGSIIEHGVNSNGRYYKYDNGLVVMMSTLTIPNVAASTSSVQWTLPVEAIATDSISASLHTNRANIGCLHYYYTAEDSILTFEVSTTDDSLINADTSNLLLVDVTFYGRWK